MPEENQQTFEQKLEAAENAVGAGFYNLQQAQPNAQSQSQEGNGNQQQQNPPQENQNQQQQQENQNPFNETDYLKTNFGYESLEVLKKEFDELKKYKSEPLPVQEIKYANEESKKFFEAIIGGKEDEAYEVMSRRRQLASAEKLDVTDVNQASNLIRVVQQLKHKNLDSDEVNDWFFEQYQKPLKPKQLQDQDDEEYNQVVSDWKTKCDAIDKKIIRDAKMMQPDLAQFKSQIVPPDIPKPEAFQKEPTQEDLDRFAKDVESFNQGVEAEFKNLNEFSVTVKDEGVEIPVSYALSQEEKNSVIANLQRFAQAGFDANALLANRWVNPDKTLKIDVILRDMARIELGDKPYQKFANDSASKRLHEYTKDKKNIQLQSSGNGQQQNGKITAEQAQDQFGDAWWNAKK